MKKLFVLVLALLTVLGCSKITPLNPKSVSRDWGELKSNIKSQMGELVPTVDEGQDLIYHNVNGYESVAYRFTSGFLTSTVVIIPGEEADLDKTASRFFPGYAFLGQSDESTFVYTSDAENTISIIYPVTQEDESFLVIGWYLKHK